MGTIKLLRELLDYEEKKVSFKVVIKVFEGDIEKIKGELKFS